VLVRVTSGVVGGVCLEGSTLGVVVWRGGGGVVRRRLAASSCIHPTVVTVLAGLQGEVVLLVGVRVVLVLRRRLRGTAVRGVNICRGGWRRRGSGGRAPVGSAVGGRSWGRVVGRGVAGLVRRSSPGVMYRRWLGVRGPAPVTGLLAVVDGDGRGGRRSRRCSPAAVGGSGRTTSCTHAVGRSGLSPPLVHHRPTTHLGIVSRLRSLDFYLLVLNVYIMFGDCLIHRGIVLEAKEAEPSRLLLLLVVHDHHLSDPAVATEEVSQVRLGDA